MGNLELTPEEAAKLIGLPAQQLRIWAYDKTGPQNSGTAWRPSYKTEHLNAWLTGNGRKLAGSIG